MPKGVYRRPKPRGLTRRAAGEGQVSLPVALEQACGNFEAEVGGREALVEHLAHVQLNKDQELLIGAIADPRNDTQSLARICHVYGIQFADLLTLFRSAGFAKAQLKAMQKVWGLLPEVAGDVMNRSVPHNLICYRCAGTGVLQRTKMDGAKSDGTPNLLRWEETCDVCAGRGEVFVQPKLETQKVALEIGGMIQKDGPGVQVNVLQQQAQAQAIGLGSFYQDSDEVLYSQPAEPEAEPIDAEVIESEPSGGAGEWPPES